MKRAITWAMLALSLAFVAGCKQEAPPAPAPSESLGAPVPSPATATAGTPPLQWVAVSSRQ